MVTKERPEDDFGVAMREHAAALSAPFIVLSESPAVWTLVHICYSGSGRCDVWIYRTERDALKAGATLAVEIYEDSPHAGEMRALHAKRRYRDVLRLYEELEPAGHVLRVQLGYFQIDD